MPTTNSQSVLDNEAPIPTDEPLPARFQYYEDHFISKGRSSRVVIADMAGSFHPTVNFGYDSIYWMLVRYDDDLLWYFTPFSTSNDENYADIGPFPTAQVAMATFRLMGGTFPNG